MKPTSNNYSEDQLVALLKVKDNAAFSILYDRYAPAINGHVIRMTGQVALSEDILQEVFIRIWNNFHLYDKAKGSLFTWMLNISRNITIDTFRSKWYKKDKQTMGEVALKYYEDKSLTPKRFDSLGISTHLTSLKAEHRQIIHLSYFKGFTQKEIAIQTGMPIGTVKTRLRAAILLLKEEFQPELHQSILKAI